MSHVLVVDDEEAIGWSLREMLTDEGHEVDLAASVAAAVAAATRRSPALILLDVRLPGGDGIDGIPDLRAVAPAAAIVVMTAFGDLETAVRAVRGGAFDYLVKPFALEQVSAVVARALADRHSAPAAGDPAPATLVGACPAMQELFMRIAMAAAGDRPVLVTGPAGCGKRLTARAIHDHSGRRGRPILTTNLSALAPAARGVELFGSGTVPGLVARAAGGTLVIEEIEAATAEVQERLATILESSPAEAGAVRIIATTRRDPARLGLADRLAAQLRSLVVRVPPLTERGDDLPVIVRELLSRHAAAHGVRPPDVSPAFLAAVAARTWPGNVRDLKAAVEHAVVVSRGATLLVDHLPPTESVAFPAVDAARREVDDAIRDWAAAARAAFGSLPEPDLHHRALRLVEATLLREALAHAGGNRTAAARLLGLDRATLRTKLRQLGLDD
ncbi:MAG: sigma-54-dependent transcriptional regulator [Planctomycetaceae bacterium]